MIRIENLSKSFTLHNQGGAVIPVMAGAALTVGPGECVGLTGQSGAGKSTLMRMVYGNYLAAGGRLMVGDLDVATAEPRQIIALRRQTLGYVSQFLRVVPRVPTLEVVAEPLLALGTPADQARERAASLLRRLNIPERLWSLSPTTFSGGEQQRVNIARGFAHAYPALLLDEPTASLDAANREVVLSLIEEAKARGAAILGIFHDEAARARVCDRLVDVDRVHAEGCGMIFAVVGPSGAGKDTLIRGAIAARPDLRLVRRVITRPAEAGGEDFEGVSAPEFALRRDRGEFALWWEAHGLSYGIPRAQVAGPGDVIFNGSRAALPEAVRVFPDLRVILVTAPDPVLAARLAARGRESEADIRARLARAAFTLPEGIAAETVVNDGSQEAGVARLLAALQPVRA